jgi:hypothetical protein
MALIFPKPMIDDVRKGLAAGVQPNHRGTTFAGDYVGVPEVVSSPGTFTFANGFVVPIWCACCGEEIGSGPAVRFMYDLYPKDTRSKVCDHWIHPESCKHTGQSIP